MRQLATLLALSTAVCALAQAAPRTFVASTGNDANTCTLTLPCRSFARALTQTDVAGEIIVLDSAGYGPVTISQSVSIIAPAGIYAGVTATSANAIIVNAPGAKVVLRGLDLNGGGTSGGSGVYYLAGADLLVDRCVISGFAAFSAAAGIRLTASGVTIANSVVRNNRRGGVTVEGTSMNRLKASLVNTRLENNGDPGFANAYDAGLAVIGAADVTVRDTVAIGNFRGFSACANDPSLPNATLSIDHSLAHRNGVGVFVAANQTACAIRISDSAITDQSIYGVEAQGGSVVTSLGNNFVHNNAGGETFGATVAPK